MLSDEDFHRITLWMDLNSNELGHYSLDEDSLALQRQGKTIWPQWPGGSGVDPDNPQGIQLQHDGSVLEPVGAAQRATAAASMLPAVRVMKDELIIGGIGAEQLQVEVIQLSGRLMSRRMFKVNNNRVVVSLDNARQGTAGVYIVKLAAPRTLWSHTLEIPAGIY